MRLCCLTFLLGAIVIISTGGYNQIYHFGPHTVAKDLNSFWQPIWQRDGQDPSFVTAADPTTQFGSSSKQIPIDMLDTDKWSIAIRKLKAGSAQGVDTISAANLAQVPNGQIDGFDADLMIGSTCPLANTAGLPPNSATRVLPQIYRLWAAVACQQLSRLFVVHIPKEVTDWPSASQRLPGHCIQPSTRVSWQGIMTLA